MQLHAFLIEDLWQAIGFITLEALAKSQSPGMWRNTCKNVKHIFRSSLRGVVHLNRQGYQHYDCKGEKECILFKSTES